MNAEDWGHGVVMDHYLNPVEFWSLGFYFYYYYYYTSEFYYTDFDYMGDWKVSSYNTSSPFQILLCNLSELKFSRPRELSSKQSVSRFGLMFPRLTNAKAEPSADRGSVRSQASVAGPLLTLAGELRWGRVQG